MDNEKSTDEVIADYVGALLGVAILLCFVYACE
jgi:VanZ family protein